MEKKHVPFKFAFHCSLDLVKIILTQIQRWKYGQNKSNRNSENESNNSHGKQM